MVVPSSSHIRGVVDFFFSSFHASPLNHPVSSLYHSYLPGKATLQYSLTINTINVQNSLTINFRIEVRNFSI